MMLSLLLLTTLLASSLAQIPEFVDFEVTNLAIFQCADEGFRCGYVKEDYAVFTIEGQDSIGQVGGQGNNIWSNVDGVDNTLTLEDCQIDYCFVRCNYGCECTTDDGSECLPASSVPAPAPTPAPEVEVCPERINTQLCAQMLDVVPAGNLDSYNCFNFCNYTFVSSCDFGGSCGNYQCGVDGSTSGSITGIVVGCTKDELLADGGSTNGGDGGSTSMAVCWGRTVVGLVAVLVAAMV